MDELFRDRCATRVEILIFHDQYDDRFLFLYIRHILVPGGIQTETLTCGIC